MSRPQEILDFWFGRPEDEDYGKIRPVWFNDDPQFAEKIRQNWREDFEVAAEGKLNDWQNTPEGALALVLLFDQASNILYRHQAKAFETDAQAREIARLSIEKGFDQQFPDNHRWFFYLPFEHSENADDQNFSVQLFSSLAPTEENKITLDYALRHKRVIDRFGRFPNRNDALGRESTPEEKEFLAGPNAPF